MWLIDLLLEKCQRVKIVEKEIIVEKEVIVEKEMNLENVIEFLTDLQKFRK